MKTRLANTEDLPSISTIHKVCFKDSFSTQLGKRLLSRFYYEYLAQNPDLFIVAEEDDTLIGFCMGYLCKDSSIMKKFIVHNFLSFAIRCFFLIVTGNPCAWKKLKDLFNRKKESIEVVDESVNDVPDDLKGDLLSICVLPSYRRRGVAENLVCEYLSMMRKKNLKYCLLSVDPNNAKAIRLYERVGFHVYRKASEVFTYVQYIE